MSYSPTSDVKQTGLVWLGKRISADRASRDGGEIAERDGPITVRALCVHCSLGTALVPDDGHDDGHERNSHNDRWHKGRNDVAHHHHSPFPPADHLAVTAITRLKSPTPA